MKNTIKNCIKILSKSGFSFSLFCLCLFIGQNISAQTPLTYKDSQGRTVTFPFGEISFADRVVGRQQGNPPSTNKNYVISENVLGVPDYKNGSNALSLGRNGSVTVEFTDNYLVDIEGPDLWIFEIGPAVESTKLEISKDGNIWIDIGTIRGSTSGIDISTFTNPGDRFSFVRVTDSNNGSGQYAGADIDAIGAIGSIKKNKVDENPKMPIDTDGNGCCNTLRIEKSNGSVEIVNLSNGKRLTNFSNVRSISFACEKDNSAGNQNSGKKKTQMSEIINADDFKFISINGRAVGEATRLCTNSLLECGSERIGYYGIEGVGGPETDNFREETFTYRDQNGRNLGVYLLTQTGFEDDSVAGERLRLEFVKKGNGWELFQGGRQFQCARGNNAGSWIKELCP